LVCENKKHAEPKGTFRVKKNIRKKLAKRKRKIEKRTQKRNWTQQSKPVRLHNTLIFATV
jgi:hypothetical protein